MGAALVLAGCSHSNGKNEAMTADLERDLQLANSVKPHTQFVSALEQNSSNAPSGNEKGQRAVVTTRKKAPIKAPSPTVEEVGVTEDVNMQDPAAKAVVTADVPVPTPAPAPQSAP